MSDPSADFVTAMLEMENAARAVCAPSEAGLLDRVSALRQALAKVDTARQLAKAKRK